MLIFLFSQAPTQAYSKAYKERYPKGVHCTLRLSSFLILVLSLKYNKLSRNRASAGKKLRI